MGTVNDERIQGLLDLPTRDRVEIALRLFESVTDQCAPPLSAEWIEEIRSRMDELEAGTADCIPIEEFMQEIRAKLL